MPDIAKEVVAGTGTILPVVIAAGGGALIGAALGRLMHERHAVRVREQLERGDLLLWVGAVTSAKKRYWRFYARIRAMTSILMKSRRERSCGRLHFQVRPRLHI
jgi:hypothetical protein